MTTGHSVPDTVLRDTVSVFPGELAATRMTVLRVGYVVAGELHKENISGQRYRWCSHSSFVLWPLSRKLHHMTTVSNSGSDGR